MLFEAAHDWKMDLYAIELNLFVDTILSRTSTNPATGPGP
jgi:hypothetical protein